MFLPFLLSYHSASQVIWLGCFFFFQSMLYKHGNRNWWSNTDELFIFYPFHSSLLTSEPINNLLCTYSWFSKPVIPGCAGPQTGKHHDRWLRGLEEGSGLDEAGGLQSPTRRPVRLREPEVADKLPSHYRISEGEQSAVIWPSWRCRAG